MAILVILAFVAFTALPSANCQCFIQGECVESIEVLFHLSETVLDCQELCQNDDDCNWFSWKVPTKVCLGFSNCLSINENKHPDSVTGNVDCESYQCWLAGSCDGTYINSYIEVGNYSSCLDKCQNEMDGNCEWFSYSASEDLCVTLQDCKNYDDSCATCSTGEKSCFQDLTTTTMITTTTMMTTTTRVPELEPNLIVIGGSNGTFLSDVEIISFNDSIQCPKPDDYPIQAKDMVGGVFEDELMVCGGRSYDGEEYQPLSSCYKLDFSSGRGKWVQVASMIEKRYFAAATVLDKGLFVIGGKNDADNVNTTEFYQGSEWTQIEKMPYKVREHCSSSINGTHFIIIGGYPSYRSVYIFDSTTSEWIKKADLPGDGRLTHSCGKMSSSGNEILVVGGYHGSGLSSTVIYDVDSNEWRDGPSLPRDLYGSQMVLVHDVPTMVAGSSSTEGGYQNMLWQLKDGQWVEMEQKLEVARWAHVASMLSVPNCV